MKKVGIITFHNAHNYGAVLQAYALQCQIEKLGYDVNIIDYRNRNIEKSYKLIKLSKNPIRCARTILESIKYYKKNKKRFEIFNDFINKKLKLTKRYRSMNELKKYSPNMDIYITGSDQVWNYEIVGELSDAYTLNFGAKEVNRISYAASIGNSEIKDEYKEKFKEKMPILNHISVREETAKRELKKLINKQMEVVLDPTLLLTKEEWNSKICNKENLKEEYILAYVVKPNEEYRKIVNNLSERTGLKVIHFEKKNVYNHELRSAYAADPFEFVNLIKNAKYVVATSFHATVFSVLYHKNFFIIPHINTGSRIINLLDKLDIKNRVFYKLEDFIKYDFESKINYENVDKKLEEERKKSINFLKEALKD